MRNLAIVLAALACAALTVPARAAAPGDITFGLDGGVGIPAGDFGKAFRSGFTAGVFGDYAVTRAVAVGIDGSWEQFKEKDVPFQVVVVDELGAPLPGGTVSDWKAEIVRFGAHLKVSPPLPGSLLAPYLQVGAGLYDVKNKISSDVPDLSSEDSKSKFGFNLGIGADYRLTPSVGVGGFGAWHSVSSAFAASGTANRKSANYFVLGLKVTFSTGAAGARAR